MDHEIDDFKGQAEIDNAIYHAFRDDAAGQFYCCRS